VMVSVFGADGMKLFSEQLYIHDSAQSFMKFSLAKILPEGSYIFQVAGNKTVTTAKLLISK